MTVQIVHKTLSPNQTQSFKLAGQSYALGLSYFDLSFGEIDHHVRTMQVSLSTSHVGDTILVTPHAVLEDDSGNSIDVSASKVGVVLVSMRDETATLANRISIASGEDSEPIAVAPGAREFESSFISGFNLSYGNVDHHLERASSMVGLTRAGESATIGARAQMADDSGHSAKVANLNAGFAAFADGDGVESRVLAATQSETPVSVEFSGPVKNAAVLIQSWQVEFQKGSDHHMRRITAGTSGWSVDQNTVTLADLQATIADSTGHTQSNENSNVSALILALQ